MSDAITREEINRIILSVDKTRKQFIYWHVATNDAAIAINNLFGLMAKLRKQPKRSKIITRNKRK